MLLGAGRRDGLAPDGLAVGTSTAAVRRSLGTAAAAAGRALLRRSDGRYADVRVAMRRGRVSRITVDLRAYSALDAAGRRLASGKA